MALTGTASHPAVNAVAPASTMLLAAAMAMAMVAPSIAFILQLGEYGIVASLGVFVLPLALIVQRARYDAQFAQTAVAVLVLVLLPLIISVTLHIDSYSMRELAFAVVRICATALYMLTIAMLLGRPDAPDVLRLAFQLLAIIFAVMFAVTAVVAGKWTWGRFSAGAGRENWWGEIFVAIAFAACFWRTRALRYGTWLFILVCLVLVSSRKSILSALIIMAFGTLDREGLKRLIIITISAGMVLLPVLLLADILSERVQIFAPIYNYIYSDVLLLDNKSRGLGTGMSGRASNWAYGWSLIQENPIIGVGFSITNFLSVEATGILMHNGHLMLISDIGVPGYVIIFSVVVYAIARMFSMRNFVIGGYLVCFWFIQATFSPRIVNVSVLSMLFWMLVTYACLLSSKPAKKAGKTEGEGTPPWPVEPGQRRPIGLRWAREGYSQPTPSRT